MGKDEIINSMQYLVDIMEAKKIESEQKIKPEGNNLMEKAIKIVGEKEFQKVLTS
jgi:hypothetical protein